MFVYVIVCTCLDELRAECMLLSAASSQTQSVSQDYVYVRVHVVLAVFCVEKQAVCAHAYAQIYLTWIYVRFILYVNGLAFVWHTHILCLGWCQGLILHSVSPTRWLPVTLGWSVIHFQILYIAIIKGGLEARFPHGNKQYILFFGAPRNISNQGKPFPVGISSTTPAVASCSAARLTLRK